MPYRESQKTPETPPAALRSRRHRKAPDGATLATFANPFPRHPVPRENGLANFVFLDRLLLRPFDDQPTRKSGHFMVERDFGVQFRVFPAFGKSYVQRIIVPGGFMTDLASIPEPVQMIPGFKPWGRVLRPSVLHDWLFSLANEFGPPRKQDFEFANRVMYGLMRVTRTPRRKQIFHAVESEIGWRTYSRKRVKACVLLPIWRKARVQQEKDLLNP